MRKSMGIIRVQSASVRRGPAVCGGLSVSGTVRVARAIAVTGDAGPRAGMAHALRWLNTLPPDNATRNVLRRSTGDGAQFAVDPRNAGIARA
ncbi:MAG: hypothetical protein AAFO79_01505 [Pseudomonadota bacterium]